MEGGGSASAGDAAAGQQQSPSSAVPIPSSSSSSSSVEALLSVPLGLILRELPTPASATAAGTVTGAANRRTRRRALLSRSEATTLLRVTQLSIEQDVLVQLAADVLANAHMCSTLRQRIEDSCRSLYGCNDSGNGNTNGGGEAVPPVRYPRHLLALLPILSIHADSIPDRTVRHVQAESQRILTELAQCATALRQCAEHNWTVSEHLLVDIGEAAMVGAVGAGAGAGGTVGSNVGRDKESLAEIEEAVCDRIEGLIGMAVDTGSSSSRSGGDHNASVGSPAGSRKRKRGAEDARGAIPQDVFDVSVDYTTGEFVSMTELCQRLFADLKGETVQGEEECAAGSENNTTAGGEAAAEEPAGASSSGVQRMDVDKPPHTDNDSSKESSQTTSTAPSDAKAGGNFASGTNQPGFNNNHKASESSSTIGTSIDKANCESSVAKDSSNDNESEDEDAKLAAIDNGEEDDLPRGASSSSSPSQSQVNAATALAVLAST
mmetsp:Transcript_21189/g.60783  ORF Transcript_21189/g.60783 Transcript_21189/m.60783 type:complete len:492 (+) Transcript_21189:92-1567(+)